MRGHLHFAASLLRRRPKLSSEFDALHCLPVHLAAIKGHADLVEKLLGVNQSCWSIRDEAGRTVLHLVAMKGRVNVLNVMIRCCPVAILYHDETILHLCVRYNQLEALMVLVEASNEHDRAFVTVPDDTGNTILHLAIFLNRFEVDSELDLELQIKHELILRNLEDFGEVCGLKFSVHW
ncbi:hypothetical protein F3Y22_tig00111678pilonHSYRG00118 [Hibiscus syriacus]|uniref:Uncharacterized protein n=1 Tax=Hibiscus syriacus TaxID=106335 RepID=A0A6A2YHI5_HIBSY|nr:hypothetical protein F3Y22_tig00111678pilonHSYRG00118 [Hibiscus syriacus]